MSGKNSYAKRKETIARLAHRGLSPTDIRYVLQISDIRVVYRALNEARRNGRKITRAPRRSDQTRRTVTVPTDILDDLSGPAALRGITVNELARRLLGVIAEDRIADNVLDDGVTTQ